MGSFSSSTTLEREVAGNNTASITVEEIGYDFNQNLSTIRITLSTTIYYRWDSGGGYLWARIYTPWEESESNTNIYVESDTITNATTHDQGYTWSYSFTRYMHARYDGVTECSADWGWRKVGSNPYSSNTTIVAESAQHHTIGTHNRVSTLTINNPSITIDNTSTLSMTITRKSTAMTNHDLIITYPSDTQNTYRRVIELRNSTVTSNTYKIPTELLSYLPSNGKTIQGRVVLRSYYLPKWYDGATKYADSSPITFTATARDSDISPTLTLDAVDWTNDNNVTSGLVGNLNNYILNVSKCKLTGMAQTKYGATISSFGLFTNDNKSLGIANTGTNPNYEFYLNQIAQSSNFSASNTLKVQITDSRGITGSATVPLSFIPYIKKLFNTENNVKRFNETSKEVKITSVTGKWWNGNFLGNTNNNLTISWDYKEASSTGNYLTGGTIDTLNYSSGTPSGTYTTYDNSTQTFTISNYSFTKNGSTNIFDYQKAYIIRLTLADAVTDTTVSPLYITISAGVANFTIHKDTILINGKTIWDILYPIGSIYTSVSPTNPKNFFTGTDWVAFGEGRTLVGVGSNGTTSYNTVEDTGGSPTHSHDLSNHTHTSAWHTHGLGAGYAKINPSAQSNYLWYNLKSVADYSETGRMKTSEKETYSSLSTSARGISLGGTTDGTTPNNTGGPSTNATSTVSSMQPYITVYFWKRTA